jgi:hypothetical protein
MAELDISYLSALIRDVHRGSTDAFCAIFLATFDRVYKKAYGAFDSVYDVQDCVRSTYIRLWNEMPRIKNAHQFRIRFLAICRKSRKDITGKNENEGQAGASKSPDKMSLSLKRSAADRLEPEIRSHMIHDVLSTVGAGEPSIPLEQIESYNTYRHHRSKLVAAIFVMMIIIAVTLPLLYFPPFYSVTKSVDNHSAPYFTVRVKSRIIKVRSVTASVNGHSMPVYRDSDRVFRVVPSKNGKVYIRITLANRMSAVVTRNVSGIDDEPPKIISDKYSNGSLRLALSDSSGVRSGRTYLLDSTGNVIHYSIFHTENNTCRFDVSAGRTYAFHTEDMRGNVLNVKIHIDGSDQ